MGIRRTRRITAALVASAMALVMPPVAAGDTAGAAGIGGRRAADLPPLPSEAPEPPPSASEAANAEIGPGVPPPAPGKQAVPGVSDVKGYDPAKSIVASRTETATIYKNPDGTNTAEIHAAPVNFRDRKSKEWKPFDDTLVDEGDKGYRQA